MARVDRVKRGRAEPKFSGISALAVEGYKSLHRMTEIDLRPLTVLAGANSSGKSSLVQPMLLLKQTLETPYDPGALLLDGPHVRFTSADQLLTSKSGKMIGNTFSVMIHITDGEMVHVRFDWRRGKGFDVMEMTAARPHADPVPIHRDMTRDEILRVLPRHDRKMAERFEKTSGEDYHLAVTRERCFLRVGTFSVTTGEYEGIGWADPLHQVHRYLRGLIHVPALRGNPLRTYATTAVGSEFPGTFEPYVASIIHHWQSVGDSRLELLGEHLEKLDLTWKIQAYRIDDTRVELRVGRLPRRTRATKDLVSIADVGFGLSQALPVLVGLIAARPGQLVYLEQPEIHLHPRAQVAFAQLLVAAVRRGVRVLVETHSSILMLGIQALIAEGALPHKFVALHWFSRTSDGLTEVRSAELDEAGTFGDWPQDFDQVTLDVQSRFLDAAEAQQITCK